MTPQYQDVPIGIKVIQKASLKCFPEREFRKSLWYRISVLVLTYVAYTCYHLSRKPISVVKNVLNQNCSAISPPRDIIINDHNKATWCDWAPFDGEDASTLLGTLDSSFLFAYGAAMFVSGVVAERVNLRYFLSLGMILSGVFCYLFGIARNFDIHEMWYFMLIQVLGGIVQTTGWPGVVTVVGNWFGEGNRGLIFGVWNSHTSVGNILGSIIASEYVETDWSLSFVVPGVIIAGAGFILFLFLVTSPTAVGCIPPHASGPKGVERNGYRRLATQVVFEESSDELDDGLYAAGGMQEIVPLPSESTPITSINLSSGNAIGFLAACRIPGVIEFSLSLFFSKLVSYTFLYWLPLYINHSTSYSATTSALLSTLFDVGGIVGGIAAGVISDRTGMSATTCVGMLVLAVPMMFLYDGYGAVNLETNIFLLIIVGILVNGPYSLISTAVSAELGTHKSLEGNARALATVTAIIDGTGSIGAAVGPLLAGVVSKYGWVYVFYMLMVSDVVALLCLARLVAVELGRYRRNVQVQEVQ